MIKNRFFQGLIQVEEVLKTKKTWYIWDYYKYSNDKDLNIHGREFFNDMFRQSFKKYVFIGIIIVSLICITIGLIF